jgi:hypothetical protein
MFEIFIHAMEVTLISLVGVLVYKIHYLYSDQYSGLSTPANINSATASAAAYADSDDSDYQETFITVEKTPIAPSSFNLNTVLTRLFQSDAPESSDYEVKMKSLQKAQVFAGTQLLEIKRNYGDLHQECLSWLKEPMAHYLIGASDFIGHNEHCKLENRKELVTLVLRSNLNIPLEDANSYIFDTLHGDLNQNNAKMVKEGAKAADSWLTDGTVSNKNSLSAQLDELGIFA